MKYLFILIFSLFLFPKSFQKSTPKTYLPIYNKINYEYSNKSSMGLHKALLTGSKHELNPKYKKTLQQFGLLHLLTPSGLHLSSIIFIFSFSAIIETVFLLIILYLLIFTYNGYDSMLRVSIFRVIYKLIKKKSPKQHLITFTFFITVIISLLLGHYKSNPLSFLYSFIFWGTILSFRKNKLLMVFVLHIVQILISLIMSSPISPLSLIVNPLITSIFSIIYPVFLGIHLIPTETLSPTIIDYFSSTIELLGIINIIPCYNLSIVTVILSLLLLIQRQFVLFPLILCLNINTTQQYPKRKTMKILWNLPPYNEVISIKKNRLKFIDRVCVVEDEILCKKKPSKMGGLNL